MAYDLTLDETLASPWPWLDNFHGGRSPESAARWRGSRLGGAMGYHGIIELSSHGWWSLELVMVGDYDPLAWKWEDFFENLSLDGYDP